jgi:hypothetical protein
VLRLPYKDRDKRKAYHRSYNRSHYAKHGEKRREEVKKRRRSIKQRFEEYKRTLSCVDCGFSGDDCPWAIEFDHVGEGRETKSASVSHLVSSGYSWDRIMEEVAKCEPVCSTHHRIRERARFIARKEATGEVVPALKSDTYQEQRHINRKMRKLEQKRMRRAVLESGRTPPGPPPDEEE